MPTFKQLELYPWGNLKNALNKPEIADFQQLWQGLEDAIAPLENNQQLHVAAEASSQIVEVYVKRANSILDSLEVTDNSQGPVLDDNFLSGLMRQSMSLDLSDLMEELAVDTEVNSDIGSRVSVLDRKEARTLARKARAQMRKALKGLAEQEDIAQWQNAITLWINQHQGEKVSLLQLQQALGMPLVEVWLGLILLHHISGRVGVSFTLKHEIFGLAINKDPLARIQLSIWFNLVQQLFIEGCDF